MEDDCAHDTILRYLPTQNALCKGPAHLLPGFAASTEVCVAQGPAELAAEDLVNSGLCRIAARGDVVLSRAGV